MEYVYTIEKSMAGRVAALHHCYTQESLRPYVAGLQLFFAKEDRFRLRPFKGTLAEIEFHLQTFGVPTHVSPLQEDGSWNFEWLHESLHAQRLREKMEAEMEELAEDTATKESTTALTAMITAAQIIEEPPPDENIVIPRRFDVILGKSAQARVHTGNRRAIHLCQMHYETYERANKFKKTEVAEHIVSIIRQSGGRFVKWEKSKGGWVEELEELIARKKIGHFLRYMRSKATKAAQNNEEAMNMSNESRKCGRNKISSKRGTPPASTFGLPLFDNSAGGSNQPTAKRMCQL